MRKAARVIFAALCSASLLVCAAGAAMWARSHRAADAAAFRHRGRLWRVASSQGRLRLDDEPQWRLELDEVIRENHRLDDAFDREFARIEAERDAVLQRWSATPEAQRDRARTEAELERLDWQWQRLWDGNKAAHRANRARWPAKPVARSVPYAVPVAAAAVLPAAWFTAAVLSARRRRHRRLNNLCPACGYDLRGGTESARCPECGHSVPREITGRRKRFRPDEEKGRSFNLRN